jgi:hypothetical protein
MSVKKKKKKTLKYLHPLLACGSPTMYFSSNKLENWDRKQWEIANVKSPDPITMIDQ